MAQAVASASVPKIRVVPNETVPESQRTRSPSTRSAPTYSRMTAPGDSWTRTFCGPMGTPVEFRTSPSSSALPQR